MGIPRLRESVVLERIGRGQPPLPRVGKVVLEVLTTSVDGKPSERVDAKVSPAACKVAWPPVGLNTARRLPKSYSPLPPCTKATDDAATCLQAECNGCSK